MKMYDAKVLILTDEDVTVQKDPLKDVKQIKNIQEADIVLYQGEIYKNRFEKINKVT